MNALAQTFFHAKPVGFGNCVLPAFGPQLNQVSQQDGGLITIVGTDSVVLTRAYIDELDRVRLLGDVATAGGTLSSGTIGTAVYRYRDGVAFEVEFQHPFHAVLTLRSGEVERLSG